MGILPGPTDSGSAPPVWSRPQVLPWPLEGCALFTIIWRSGVGFMDPTENPRYVSRGYVPFDVEAKGNPWRKEERKKNSSVTW